MDETTLYYFFSTLAQTYGAIVGLIGMLTVYRSQQLRDHETQAARMCKNASVVIFKKELSPEELKYSWPRKKDEMNLPDAEIERHTGYRNIEQSFVSILKFSIASRGIKDRFIWFLISNVAIIFFSLILLPFCETLKASGWKYFWVIVLLILVVVSLFFTIRLCLMLVETPFKDVWNRTWTNIKRQSERCEKALMKYI